MALAGARPHRAALGAGCLAGHLRGLHVGAGEDAGGRQPARPSRPRCAGEGRGAATAGWVRPVAVPPRFVPFFSDSSRVCLPWVRFKAFGASERASSAFWGA